jgi:hypothetical protein
MNEVQSTCQNPSKWSRKTPGIIAVFQSNTKLTDDEELAAGNRIGACS